VKLDLVTIENYRAIDYLALPLDPSLTVLHGDNAHGKTSVLSAIAVGLGNIPTLLPEVSGIRFLRIWPKIS
jgi:recombinational DNA repair ATPase RecF